MIKKKAQKHSFNQRILKDIEWTNSIPSNVQNENINTELMINEKVLRDTFHGCSDVIFRLVDINRGSKLLFIYMDGLSDTKTLEKVVLQPIMYNGLPNSFDKTHRVEQIIEHQLIAISQVQKVSGISDVVNGILKGSVALLVDGANTALVTDLKEFEKRNIEEPSAESTIRGPRDGFTETLRINTSLVRRRIRSVKLKMESYTIGQLSQTDIVIAYIAGIVPISILEEVQKRIRGIQIDGVMESSYIEEFIEDFTGSPFPQIQNSERPDVICSSLLEGKVAIFVDNTPFVLVVPMTFWSGLQAADDYYERSIYTSFIRIIRLCLFNIALLFPSLFVATITYHPQLIPTTLLISIAGAREGVPFPTVIETLLMEFMFEGLREAGIRLPKPVGSAVSIVGALVIGQAAVQAGIVSAPVVIVVSTTGIASFAIPRYNLGTSYRFLRFPMLVLAGTLGLYGIVMGVFCILIHLLKLRSFGVPYLSPVSPLILKDLKDVFIRVPRWGMINRPSFSSTANKKRTFEGQQQNPNTGDQTDE
ncbi:spore germination protein [Neobacillus sp. MM2021_6]|uniref:spore germination protein n=1 Tax=Bacillaceae TaxID=186817 RepID=UPI001407CCED|nr:MULTISPECIES: spore germination protein [Bacillaceae]MBO0958446.1 spore germination protein [Neobacillus sp. MM2021_6]NHC20737.1 spore germination protein [Bacillus sp. MM2020_4]